MRSSVAITIEGVLRRDVGSQPIPEGLALYRMLVQHYNVILLADIPEQDPDLEHFFQVEQLKQHGMVFYSDNADRVDQAYWLRNSGHALDFVIEPDPLNSAALMRSGFNVMHFMHAQYTRPDWRPGRTREVTPWDDLVRQETELKVARAGDKRMDR